MRCSSCGTASHRRSPARPCASAGSTRSRGPCSGRIPELIVGGQSPPAFRRAVHRADGWYGFAMPPEAVSRSIDGLKRAADSTDRPAALGDLELTVTPPPGPVDADTVDRYRQLGVARLVILPGARDVRASLQVLSATADAHL